VLFPLWSALTISTLNDAEVAVYPPRLWPSGFNLDNFGRALRTSAAAAATCSTASVQSTIVMVGQLATASLAAYAFAFIPFKGRNFLFLVFLSTYDDPVGSNHHPELPYHPVAWLDRHVPGA
jgi:sn-glycerol 3-phosphate transport system permease protein